MKITVNGETIADTDANLAAVIRGGISVAGDSIAVATARSVAAIRARGRDVHTIPVTVGHTALTSNLEAERKIIELLSAGRRSGALVLSTSKLPTAETLTYSHAVATPTAIKWRGAFVSCDWEIIAGGATS